ncbi:hypothetical protein [Changpingibacter yushuensis]|uniref:hypothetical protein n=1 Tax=Changpingibacter yushuensis TaxID=2758440 RepID=UPI0015F40346|nr:hypothetical protein [Changpingibacter yushuensis]
MKTKDRSRSDKVRDRNRRVVSFVNHVSDRVWSFLALAATLILTVVPLVIESAPKLLFMVVGVIALGSGLLAAKQERSTNELVEENTELCKEMEFGRQVIGETIEILLENICREADSWNSNCRATVYVHKNSLGEHPISASGSLVPVARTSFNPNLKRKGRAEYPDNVGFVGATWEQGFTSASFESTNELLLVKLYTKRVRKWPSHIKPLDEATASALTMKSSKLIGIRIDAHHRANIGVVMFESLSKDDFQQVDENTLRDSKEIHVLQKLLDGYRPYLDHVSEGHEPIT